MGYYSLDEKTPIEEAANRWKTQGHKAYDDSMPVHYHIDHVWPHREYTRKREDDPARWDKIHSSMKERGWDPEEPAHVEVGKNGGIKVGEGNHRLAVARSLGIKKVPVRIHFQDKVTKSLILPRVDFLSISLDQLSKSDSASTAEDHDNLRINHTRQAQAAGRGSMMHDLHMHAANLHLHAASAVRSGSPDAASRSKDAHFATSGLNQSRLVSTKVQAPKADVAPKVSSGSIYSGAQLRKPVQSGSSMAKSLLDKMMRKVS